VTDERRETSRISAAWPITVVTDKGMIEGESVNITPFGVFLRSSDVLKENETYQMIITLPNEKQVLLKGKLVWSNLNGEARSEAYSNMGFSFVRVREEDERLLRSVISLYGPGGEGEKEQ
jgi:hypothetical protein